MQNSAIVERLFIIFSLFPFMSFYPINTDIQPLFILFGILVIFKKLIIESKSIRLEYVLLFLFSILLLFNINFNKNEFIFYFSTAISPLVAIIVIIAFIYSKNYLTSKLFSNVVSIYFGFSILTFIMPDIFITMQSYLVRNVNVLDVYGIRGISTFSTEPGLFAGLLISFLIINDYLLNKNKLNLYTYRKNLLFILLMLILTKSGTGYLLFMIYLIFKLFNKFKINLQNFLIILIFIPIIISLVLFLNDIFQIRGLDILAKLILNPQKLFEEDLSILTRVASLYIGLVSPFYYPLGYGVNNINDAVKMIIDNNVFLSNFPKFEYFDFSQKISLTSSLAMLSVIYGLLWWLLFYVILFHISKANNMAKFFATLFICFSYSAAFPLIWILLSLNCKDKND